MVRRILPANVADVALGLICDCGALKSTATAARCLECARGVPRVIKPKSACVTCGGPASQASELCLLCRTGRTPRCAHCGQVFAGRRLATCSDACAAARQVAIAEGLRRHNAPSDRDRAAKRRRRERIRAVGGVTGSAAAGRWRRICDRDGWTCWICGDPIDPTLIAPHRYAGTADHVIAIADGGPDDDGNLRAAHFRCNSKRQRGGAVRYLPVEVR